MNVAIYGRISTDRQSELSIESQFEACRQYCKRNGWDVYDYYAEVGVSGTGTEKRDQLQRLLKDAQLHKFNVVVAHKVDRAFRNTRDYENVKYDLEHMGVIMAFAETGSNADPGSELMNGMFALFAQNYSRNLARETKKTARLRVEAGQFLGGFPPLGYMIVNKKFEINPDLAPVVRDIYQRYASGESMQSICDMLNDKGLKTARGSDFRVTTLHEILKNEKYIGVYVHNKFSFSQYGHRKGKTPGEDIFRVEGVIPEIIEKEIWEEVQKKMIQNKRLSRQKSSKNEYLLSGLITCLECGYSYSGCPKRGKNGKDVLYYSCGGRTRHNGCKAPSLRVDWIDDTVIGLLLKLCDQLDMNKIVEDVNKNIINAKSKAKDCIKDLEAQHRKLMFEGRKLVDLYLANDTSPAIKEKMQQNTKDIEAINALIAEAKLIKSEKLTPSPDIAIRLLEMTKERLLTGTTEEKRAAIQALISKIEVEKENIKVYLKPTSGSSESGYKAMVAEAGFEPTTFGL